MRLDRVREVPLHGAVPLAQGFRGIVSRALTHTPRKCLHPPEERFCLRHGPATPLLHCSSGTRQLGSFAVVARYLGIQAGTQGTAALSS